LAIGNHKRSNDMCTRCHCCTHCTHDHGAPLLSPQKFCRCPGQ
jgi:hypothetical protein